MTSSERIQPHHLSRQAIVYVRQSTAQQAINNRESLELQYALRHRVRALGWPDERIVVIDADVGLTGSTVEGRLGFQELVSRVSLDQAGAVFAFDVTRLARNCSDWYQLLDLCGLRHCLIGDGDSLYDPAQIDGRLLLGLKGQISELELHTIRLRLNAGLMNKAKRGELIVDLPIGYIKAIDGLRGKHPDAEVQSRIDLVFRKFMELKSLGKVVRFMNDTNLKMPRRIRGGLGVRWCEPTKSAVSSMIRNPTYAGAYAYGKTRFIPQTKASHKRRKQRIDQDQWKVLIQDRHSPYIGWDQFMSIQKMLEDNHAQYLRNCSSGAPRQGQAMLQGIVYCGKCGHQMTVQYHQGGQYRCNYLYQQCCKTVCLTIRSNAVDIIVSAAVLEALESAQFDLFEQSLSHLQQDHDALQKASTHELQRLRYQAELAERQYQHCDPANRLVAAELERRWEESLHAFRDAEQRLQQTRDQHSALPDKSSLKRWREAGTAMTSLWSDDRLGIIQKKRVVRVLIEKVILNQLQPGRVEIRIVWQSGLTTARYLDVKVGSLEQLAHGQELKQRVTAMAKEGHCDEWIAWTLSREGFRLSSHMFVTLGFVSRLRCHAGLKIDRNNQQRRVETGLTLAQLARRIKVSPDWILKKALDAEIALTPDESQKRFLIAADNEIVEKLKALRKAETAACAQGEAMR